MSRFPLFVGLAGHRVLVVGGGDVARRKIELLLRAGARPLVIAPVLEPALARLVAKGLVLHETGPFEPAQLAGCRLAIAATDDRPTNAAVAAASAGLGILVNVVDDPALSSAIVPAIVDRSPLVVAISSGGTAPVLARRIRAEIESMLDESWSSLAALCERWRHRIVAALPDLAARRAFYDWLVDGPVRRLLDVHRTADAERRLGAALAPSEQRPGHDGPVGLVALVGAGPGDPGLLTLRALRVLQAADVILYDRLVSQQVLELARRDAEQIPVGKEAGGHAVSQARIHELMLQHAQAGRRVVRLKGGDPFVFGRGGEELEFLRTHGIAFEVVPGITAALACAAYAGIPLTHRDHSQSLRLITAHCRDSLDTLDWPCLARERQTLAVYMGVALAGTLQEQLLRHGRSPATPVAVIENGSRPEQRVILGRLDRLDGLVRVNAVRSPALLIVGEVAQLATSLHWFGAQPAVDPTGAPGVTVRPPRLAVG